MSSPTSKLPVWYTIAAVAALVWTIAGVASFVMDITMSEEALAAMPEAQRSIYETRPFWVVALYAIAVICAFAGAAALLVRKKLAVPFFGASLAAVILQMTYVLFGMKAVATLGAASAIFPSIVTIIGALMLWFSIQAKAKGWLQ